MIFSDTERRIYPYKRNGVAMKGDPLALLRRFTAYMGGENKMAEVMTMAREGPDIPACQAFDTLQRATCETFKLGQPYDDATGEGVMEDEWYPLFLDFMDWLKKNDLVEELSPTSSAASLASSSQGPSATKTSAA